MSDPFSIAAGAVQIADVALRTAQQIYTFLGDLRSAPEDVRQLRAVLGETEDLMRSIISYMREFQVESRLNQDYRYLPLSIESAVKWFADDVKQLRRCLPATLEITFASRVKFVFREKDVTKITARLQERKAGLSAVLSAIGRRNDLTLQRGINTITSSADIIHQQQTTALNIVQGTAVTLQQSLSGIHQLRQTSALQHAQVVTRLQSLEESLSSPPTASRPSLSLTANVPDDPDLISRMVRREIKAALEPFADTIAGRLDSVVESSTREIMTKLRETPQEDTDPSALTRASTPPTAHDEIGLGSSGHAHDPSLPAPSGKGQQWTDVQLSRMWHHHGSRFGDIEVYVCKFRERSGDFTKSPEVYFQIRVDFRPANWITSYGLSAIYSTAPDALGYYEICPRLLPFRVLSMYSKAAYTIFHDDVAGFESMLSKGEINWFDQFCKKVFRTFLEFAVYLKCPRICRFLLCDISVEAANLFRTSDYLGALASAHFPGMYKMPYQLHDMVDIYPLLGDHLSDLDRAAVQLVSLNHARLAHRRMKLDELLNLAEAVERSCESHWVFPWYNMALPAFPKDENLPREKWFMDLFLARGGDPNMRGPRRQALPLQAALELTTCYLPSRFPRLEAFLIRKARESGRRAGESMGFVFEESDKYEDFNPRCNLAVVLEVANKMVDISGAIPELLRILSSQVFVYDSTGATLAANPETLTRAPKILSFVPELLEAKIRESKYQEMPADNNSYPGEEDQQELLVPLIESGADVHAVVTDWDGDQWMLSDYAWWLGLWDIWKKALERCGYSPAAVEAESDRRMASAKRLNDGNASGIDTSFMEPPDVSGLRHRQQSGKAQAS